MNDTVKIEILGTGCKKCHQLEANAREAVASRNLTAEVEHITDMMQIVERGVMATPALVVNDEVVCQGKVLTPDEIAAHLG
ncbi:thioredoxin family protein [Methylicorpusculum sp.]|uniref:thioredoxin family protein n=1 Tax=Methylicorpusculum sp. TaxID=2713644 RepID=UPI002724441E|nr:thioredoxin family protein [Methylicorpusculum sp.]MDO9239651.1 thioredoxin family protein [Methylicorpusculum sp.]MDP2179360.1 thioredoxin family protein [Methylicorpusculum sp.]MDP3529485.1 thioredoxin family protein [Methylicorpusculum sp.]MDZ4152819.1 thioredoxin family protein [Methylicorpusculum sp.]